MANDIWAGEFISPAQSVEELVNPLQLAGEAYSDYLNHEIETGRTVWAYNNLLPNAEPSDEQVYSLFDQGKNTGFRVVVPKPQYPQAYVEQRIGSAVQFKRPYNSLLSALQNAPYDFLQEHTKYSN